MRRKYQHSSARGKSCGLLDGRLADGDERYRYRHRRRTGRLKSAEAPIGYAAARRGRLRDQRPRRWVPGGLPRPSRPLRRLSAFGLRRGEHSLPAYRNSRSVNAVICPASASRPTKSGHSPMRRPRTFQQPRRPQLVPVTPGPGRPSAPIPSWCRPGWWAGATASTRWPSSMICASGSPTVCSSLRTASGHTWTRLRKLSTMMRTTPCCRSCTARHPRPKSA